MPELAAIMEDALRRRDRSALVYLRDKPQGYPWLSNMSYHTLALFVRNGRMRRAIRREEP